MQIICISRFSYGYGKELAENLARKMGYACIGREELTDQATAAGIPVGKLEMALMKHQALSEGLAVELDLFKAFVTAALCEKALKSGPDGGIVYHGRTGHLVLAGVNHILRIRAIADMEDRIEMAMRRMHLTRDKAKLYNEQVDEDIRRWVRFLYNVNWEDPSLYDITINSAHLSVENSASALVGIARLPEFQATPSIEQTLRDLLLAARCRLAVGDNPETRPVRATVQARKGEVSVTYLPQDAKPAQRIPDLLKTVEGLRSLTCTVSTTNILYIQEKFDPSAASFEHLIEVAEKWNAAVELVRLVDAPETPEGPQGPAEAVSGPSVQGKGGILDDTPGAADQDGSGIRETLNRLVQVGRAGAANVVHGGPQALEGRISRTAKYSLIVVGDVFLSKGDAVRKRMKRDMISFLIDHMHVPVIGTEDLKEHYLFGPRQWLETTGYGLLTLLLYLVVFNLQEPILAFLSEPGAKHRVLASVAVAVLAPVSAFIIGGFAHNLLKLIKLE